VLPGVAPAAPRVDPARAGPILRPRATSRSPWPARASRSPTFRRRAFAPCADAASAPRRPATD